MLGRFPTHTTLPAADLDRARAWYAEKLDLNPTSEDPGGMWYETGGAMFAIFPTPHAGSATNTAMEWRVDDVAAVVEWLQGRGVEFETFEMEGVEWDGPIATMGPARGAWFKDSEGNTLAVTEGLEG